MTSLGNTPWMQVLLIYCFLTVSTRPAASKQLFRLKKKWTFFTQIFQLSVHHAVKLVLHQTQLRFSSINRVFFKVYCNFYDLKFYQHVFVSIKTYLLIKITKEHRYQLYKWWKLNQEKLRSDLNYMVYQSF